MEPHIHISPASIVVDALKLGAILLVIRWWAHSRQAHAEEQGMDSPMAGRILAIYG